MSQMQVAGRTSQRDHIVETAADLLRESGAAAVTTRAVAQAAGVQAPTIYRLFGDKDGLLEAVAEHTLARYVADKAVAETSDDPIADLRAGWDVHVGFGVANPDVFMLLLDAERGARSPAAAAGHDVLAERVRRVAISGRLTVPESRAIQLIRAAGNGVVLTVLTVSVAERDPQLSGEMFEAVLRSVSTQAPSLPARDAVSTAIALRAVVSELPGLTGAEQAVLVEWLDRATSS